MPSPMSATFTESRRYAKYTYKYTKCVPLFGLYVLLYRVLFDYNLYALIYVTGESTIFSDSFESRMWLGNLRNAIKCYIFQREDVCNLRIRCKNRRLVSWVERSQTRPHPLPHLLIHAAATTGNGETGGFTMNRDLCQIWILLMTLSPFSWNPKSRKSRVINQQICWWLRTILMDWNKKTTQQQSKIKDQHKKVQSSISFAVLPTSNQTSSSVRLESSDALTRCRLTLYGKHFE